MFLGRRRNPCSFVPGLPRLPPRQPFGCPCQGERSMVMWRGFFVQQRPPFFLPWRKFMAAINGLVSANVLSAEDFAEGLIAALAIDGKKTITASQTQLHRAFRR